MSRLITPSSRALRQSIILIIMLCLGACSPASSPSGRLIVWHTWDEAEAPIIEQLLDDFQRLHPEIQVSVERKDYESVLPEYALASQSGLGPDVLIGLESVFAHVLYENELIADVSEADIDWRHFESNTLQSVERDENVRIGVPLNAYVNVLYYNRSQIDTPPATLDDLIRLGESGVTVGLPITFFGSYWGITGTGGSVFNGDALSSDSEEAIADWLEWIVRFQQTPGAVLSPDTRALADSFARGDLAVVVADSLDLAAFEESLGSDQVGVATIPGYPKAQPFSTIELMMVNHASVQTDAAALLLDFMSNEAQQRKLARATSGRAPVNRSVNLNETLFPRVSVISTQNQTAVVPTTGQDDYINLLITEGDPIYQQLLEGLLSPEQAGREIINAVNDQVGGP